MPIERNLLARAGNDRALMLGIRPEAFHLTDEGLPVKVAVIEELGSTFLGVVAVTTCAADGSLQPPKANLAAARGRCHETTLGTAEMVRVLRLFARLLPA